jgi:hypothetical protein
MAQQKISAHHVKSPKADDTDDVTGCARINSSHRVQILALFEGEGRDIAKADFQRFLEQQDNAYNQWSPEQWANVLKQFLQQYAINAKWTCIHCRFTGNEGRKECIRCGRPCVREKFTTCCIVVSSLHQDGRRFIVHANVGGRIGAFIILPNGESQQLFASIEPLEGNTGLLQLEDGIRDAIVCVGSSGLWEAATVGGINRHEFSRYVAQARPSAEEICARIVRKSRGNHRHFIAAVLRVSNRRQAEPAQAAAAAAAAAAAPARVHPLAVPDQGVVPVAVGGPWLDMNGPEWNRPIPRNLAPLPPIPLRRAGFDQYGIKSKKRRPKSKKALKK